MRHLIVVGLSLSVFTGCATGGMKYTELSPLLPALGQDQGRVYFMRKASIGGAALQPDIRLDGNVVGVSKPGGFFYVDATVGPHEAAASTEARRALSFSLEANETKYIRSFPTFGIIVGRINFELVNPDEAQKELAQLSYTGASPAVVPAGTVPSPGTAGSQTRWPNPTQPGRRVQILGGGGDRPPGDAPDGSGQQDAAKQGAE